ncbi:hypothetical protein CONPUDRAFT_40291, partial [Coniophora puteana RWD-64-598 SS2]
LGMPLGAGSQRIFYRVIQENNRPARRTRTDVQVARTRHAVAEINGDPPLTEDIWRSTRDADMPVTTNGFKFKSLHDGYRLGTHWEAIPNMAYRARCPLCREGIESMEHILLDCHSSLAPIKTVWALAKALCDLKGITWPELSYGLILGCGLVIFRNPKGKKLTGASRLFKIVVSESAHLIWKLRCERIHNMHQNPPEAHPPLEVEHRWIRRLNQRLTLDTLLTNRRRFGPRAIKDKLVLQTWSGALLNEDGLSDNWIHDTGVLVGITCRRPPGRNR